MALSAAIQWEVRTAGSDTLCSGGFVAGASGTDFSQQNAAQYTGTNLVIDGAVNTKVTSATHNFVAADVGNVMQITAGSGFTTGFFEIVSVAANAATLDRSAGTLGSTAGTFAVGGALLSPGIACGAMVALNTTWIKSGTYAITSTTANAVGGRLAPTANTTLIRGYGTTRGDDAARPVIQASGIATTTLITCSNFYGTVWNLEADGAGLTSITGINVAGSDGPKAYYCVARACTNNGFTTGSTVRCRATACTTQPAYLNCHAAFCIADANTAGGFSNNSTHRMFGCIAYGNTTYGFLNSAAAVGGSWVNCTAYNNSTIGFSFSTAPASFTIVNCIAYGNGTYGYDGAAGTPIYYLLMLNCAGGANTTADRRSTPPTWCDNFITLTADPFVNKAAGNFALNTTAGGGAALRALGQPGAFADGLTLSYIDVGGAQHQDPAGGGGGTGPNVIVSSGAGSRGGSW